MKTNRPQRRTRVARDRKERVKPDFEQALRQCETAAMQIKAASDELAVCWTSLARELATGISATNLLRKRAWCNVLELRLKERSHALETARQNVDAVWQDMLHTVRSRGLLNRLMRRSNSELSAAHQVWPLLAQSTVMPALLAKTIPLKK